MPAVTTPLLLIDTGLAVHTAPNVVSESVTVEPEQTDNGPVIAVGVALTVTVATENSEPTV
jgi:hypothetical protein